MGPLFSLQKPRPQGVARDKWLRIKSFEFGERMTNVKIQMINQIQNPNVQKPKTNYHESTKKRKRERVDFLT